MVAGATLAVRPPDPPIIPGLPEPFYWVQFKDRETGPYWQARAEIPHAERFAQVHYGRRGWVATVGLYRRWPRAKRIGELMPAVEYVRRWLALHGTRAVEEAKSVDAARHFPTAPAYSSTDPISAPHGVLGTTRRPPQCERKTR